MPAPVDNGQMQTTCHMRQDRATASRVVTDSTLSARRCAVPCAACMCACLHVRCVRGSMKRGHSDHQRVMWLSLQRACVGKNLLYNLTGGPDIPMHTLALSGTWSFWSNPAPGIGHKHRVRSPFWANGTRLAVGRKRADLPWSSGVLLRRNGEGEHLACEITANMRWERPRNVPDHITHGLLPQLCLLHVRGSPAAWQAVPANRHRGGCGSAS